MASTATPEIIPEIIMLNPNEVVKARVIISQAEDWKAVAKEGGWSVEPISFTDVSEWKAVYTDQPDVNKACFAPPIFVMGQPVDPSCLNGIGSSNINVPSHSVFKTKRMRVVGWRALLSASGVLHVGGAPIRSSAELERIRHQTSDGHQGFFLMPISGPATHILYRSASRKFVITGIGAYISGLEPGNYGSFLFRMLPALLMLAQCQFNLDYIVVPERTAWMMEALRLIGLEHLQIFSIREVSGLVCENIYIASEFDNEAFIDNLSLDRFHKLVTICRSQTLLEEVDSRFLYVSRALSTLRNSQYRCLINEEDIEIEMRRRNFRIIYPEVLSFASQVTIFASAQVIVGPSGSGMLNAAFAPSGAHVIDLESFHYSVRQHAKIYASTGKTYGFVFGIPTDGIRPLHIRNWSVKLNIVEEAIDFVANL